MRKIIYVKTAELAVGKDGDIIKTGSIGSCVVIALYDEVSKIGGLAHAMLPTKKSSFIETNPPAAKYVDQAIDNLVSEIIKIGGKKENLKAKLVGGASMFKQLITPEHSIGSQNSTIAKEHLNSIGIPIEKEDIGGSIGKLVDFDLSNGILNVYTRI